MLGQISNILQNAENNRLKELLENQFVDFKRDIVGYRDNEIGIGLPYDIRTLKDDYRNSHAHTRKMGKTIFLNFRDFVYKSTISGKNGLLPRVLLYKKLLLTC